MTKAQKISHTGAENTQQTKRERKVCTNRTENYSQIRTAGNRICPHCFVGQETEEGFI